MVCLKISFIFEPRQHFKAVLFYAGSELIVTRRKAGQNVLADLICTDYCLMSIYVFFSSNSKITSLMWHEAWLVRITHFIDHHLKPNHSLVNKKTRKLYIFTDANNYYIKHYSVYNQFFDAIYNYNLVLIKI